MSIRAGEKIFKARPPEKGSFPLDHDGECKSFMKRYMTCLRTSEGDNYKCRTESKEYLECRMERDLMAKEDLIKLGFKDEKLKQTRIRHWLRVDTGINTTYSIIVSPDQN